MEKMCGDCHDSIALLLSIHVAASYANYMQHPPASGGESAAAAASVAAAASASAGGSNSNRLSQMNSPAPSAFQTLPVAVTVLDSYWDSVLELLWTRFDTIASANLHSLRAFDPERLDHVDPLPHYVSNDSLFNVILFIGIIIARTKYE